MFIILFGNLFHLDFLREMRKKVAVRQEDTLHFRRAPESAGEHNRRMVKWDEPFVTLLRRNGS
jgi:hypothetical protein